MPSADHSATSFDDLIADPIATLSGLANDMAAYSGHVDWNVLGLPEEQAARKQQDQAAFQLEIARFKEGVRWLSEDTRLQLAFRFANETMLRLNDLGGRKYTGWRLFQLVFIVSQLPALAWREHSPSEFPTGLWGDPQDADPNAAATVLWFPTGQGKTEAYLGLIVAAMFYDRLRGKGRGITAWCRFPLRLLSLQQTERQLVFIAAAEDVRLRHLDTIARHDARV